MKVFLPYQVKMLLTGDFYKVLDTLFAFQKDGEISYSKRNCEFLHIDQAIVEQAIQTAIDYKIIEFVEQTGGVYKFRPVIATLEAAKLIPLNEVPNKPLFKPSDEIKWKEQATTKERTANELLEEIERLKKELMTKVQGSNNKTNEQLPW